MDFPLRIPFVILPPSPQRFGLLPIKKVKEYKSIERVLWTQIGCLRRFPSRPPCLFLFLMHFSVESKESG